MHQVYLDKPCPQCKQRTVDYSGNYFCTSCDWALSENGHVQPWLRSLIRLRKANGKDTAREESYLTKESEGIFDDPDAPV